MTRCRQTPGVFVKLLGSFRSTNWCPKTDYPNSRIFPYSLQANIKLGKVKAKVVVVNSTTPWRHMTGRGSKTPRVLNLESRWKRLVSVTLRRIFLRRRKKTGQKAGGSERWHRRADETKFRLDRKQNPIRRACSWVDRRSTLKAVEVFSNLVHIISLRSILVQSVYTMLKCSFCSFLKNDHPTDNLTVV